MTVNDVFDDAQEITGYVDQGLILSRITDAVDTLSNKGNFDVLTQFVTITTTGTNIVTLPTDVEVPLKVNVDDQPAFSRDKAYEFTMNGPGSNAIETDWQWYDKGLVPTHKIFTGPHKLTLTSQLQDAGKQLKVTGRTDILGTQQTTTFTMGSAPITTTQLYLTIDEVAKDVTSREVVLTDDTGALISRYAPEETHPQYRRIRISRPGATVYIMFRRNRIKFTGLLDLVPVRSKMALIMMMRAQELYRKEQTDAAAVLETQAVKLATEEQNSHNAHVDLAAATEISTARNLNYNNADTIIMADVYDEACKICGPIGEPKIFDKTTEVISLLRNKGTWDPTLGYVDITTDQYHYVTLPRYVDNVIRLNVNKWPSEMKNRWFEFNSGNNTSQDWLPCRSWEHIPVEVVTIRDVLYSQKLIAVPDIAADVDTKIRVYGFYRGRPLETIDNVTGNSVPGVQIDVSVDKTFSQPDPPLFDRITRITKTKSRGFIKILGIGIDPVDSLEHEVTLGYLYPDETEPRYRRIKISQKCSTVRIMYRMRQYKITSLTDPINLSSKTAITEMMSAIEMRSSGKLQEADAMEQTAVRHLSEAQYINNQAEIPEMEFSNSFSMRGRFLRRSRW